MNFVSLLFIAFLLLTFLLFVLFPSRFRLPLLLIASYLFYATWSIPFISLIVLTTSTDYFISHFIASSSSLLRKRLFLALGLTINLIVLIFFKYNNFLLDTVWSFADWFHIELGLPRFLNILLPLGISFYTFEAISYMVDVYRGGQPANNWWRYNFYIMYFPHLISGPIVRFKELYPQYELPLKLPSRQRFRTAFELILLGYLFKVFIADAVAPIANDIFGNPQDAKVFETYLGVLAFTVQIYFDFMGYTHIARGVSLLFNIELPLNFNHPYLASNISNFWERWHISLSRWIRDYLYIPLGGSYHPLVITAGVLLLVMLIAGAWHGAGWTYILWGGFHGVLLGVYHIYKHFRNRLGAEQLLNLLGNPVYSAASLLTTFTAVAIGWVIFRATDLHSAMIILAKLTQLKSLMTELEGLIATQQMVPFYQFLFLTACCFTGYWVIQWVGQLYRPMPYWIKVQVACMVFILSSIMTQNANQPFIYFQF